jgi:methionyl-tRNA formyltransferase
MSGPFLLRTLDGLAKGRLSETPQDASAATYAGKIDRRMGCIEWGLPAHRISALIRGLDPWPGAYTTYKGGRIKVFGGRAEAGGAPDPMPGKVLPLQDGGLPVETGEGVLLVRELQAPGKKRLPAVDFLRGFPVNAGEVLGS